MTYVYGSPSRPGPEADLVQEFIENTLLNYPEKFCRTVFIEPTLKASRPDIVVVDWDPLITKYWPTERLYLEQFDLRLVQLLLRKGPLSEQQLSRFFPRRLKGILDRLDRADMINQHNDKWTLAHFENIFAVKCIATFEAKKYAMSKAVRQAFLNTWFASESYVLTDNRTPTSRIVDKARSRGVGLWLLSTGIANNAYLGAERYSQPRSYASWFFNELAWKSSLGVS